jgi:glycosyltransferase involved in cell wall biosynthesis
MGKKLVIDASVYGEPASGVHLAVRHAVSAQIPCLSDHFTTTLIANFVVAGAEQLSLPGWAKSTPGRIFWQQLFLSRLLKRLDADILQAPAYTMPLNCPIPTLLNVHDIIALEHPQLCSWRNVCHMRALLPASIRRAAKCLVPTRHVGERIHALLDIPFNKIEVVSWGVGSQRFSKKASLGGLHLPRPYYLFVGNIEPKKNLPLLLQAYASCAESSGCALVIVGRRGWKCGSLVRRLRHWQGPGQVCWLGRLPDEQVTALYQQATALVMPSLEEGFGLPVLEAMAAGSPVLHSKHPALLEVAGGAGLAFDSNDSEELARLMHKIAKNTSLQSELVAAGKKRAQFLSWEKYGKNSAEILKSI